MSSSLRVLVENGIRVSASLVPKSSKEFILQRARGTYTGIRTVSRTRVWLFDAHLRRLANSYTTITHRQIDVDTVRDAVMPSLRLAVSEFLRASKLENDAELKLTLLLSPNASNSTNDESSAKESPEVGVYVEVQPVRAPPIAVEFRAHEPRPQPEAKDTAWVSARAVFEREKAADVDEVVMYSGDDMVVSEGLSSNFAVLIDGAIHTAPKNTVLFGTVFQLIERLAQAHSIPLHLDGIRVADRSRWQAAFIASTTRGLLPIDVVRFIDLPNEPPLQLPTDVPTFVTLRKLIADEMINESTEIVESTGTTTSND
jgi:branched-subunit amino acid aminotransferase/4-amino-4-deoxychorismate lyase